MFKTAILSNAAKIIIIHNHPSGEIEPSEADETITARIGYVGQFLNIPLYDSIIIGAGNRENYSYRENDSLALIGVGL